MLRDARLEHRFVHHIPERLEPGVLYISMEFATAVHQCCCGCGEEVVTPFTPTDWKMTFDGDTISLRPSVGNWNIPCRSHYVIERNRVIEALPWTDIEVTNERRRDKRAKAQFYGVGAGVKDERAYIRREATKQPSPEWWRRFKSWFRQKRQ